MIEEKFRTTSTLPCPACGGSPSFSKERYCEMWGFNHTCKRLNPQVHVKCNGYTSLEKAVQGWNEIASGQVWKPK